MAPPGRRRPALSPLAVVLGLVLLFTSTASAASAVLGIDVGTEYIKAALVKPGIPLEIVLTKDSKRKEVSAVAFKPSKGKQLPAGSFPERFYGGDAIALQARFPGDVYPNLKQLLGIPSDSDAVKTYNERYPAVEVTTTEGRKTVSVNSGTFAEGEQSWSVEELLAMELKNVKENAKTLAGKGSSISEVVFTVPPFYTVGERRALEVAAQLAGLKVLSITTDGLAVGINYAMSREFPVVNKGGKPEIDLVFDMGAGSATATVLKFQGKQVKDVGKRNKTVQEVHVLGSGWDRTLGGDALNTLIFENMISEFVNQPAAKSASVTAEKVKSHGRAAAKLFKEAEKIRQVLSANTQTQASIESLFEDVDFRYKITRSRFEELAADYAARVEGPITRALEAAKLTLDDIDSLIIHGGGARTPFVQAKLYDLVGKSKIKTNVNADEAAVFGAAFKAASLAPSFRVKEIRDYDTQGYNHGIEYMFNLKDVDQKIFTPATKIGAPKDIPFQMMGEFEFSMYQATPGANGEIVKTPVLRFNSGNLTRAVTSLIDDSKCDRETFNNYVQVRLSPITGVPEVTSAWVTCEAEVEESKGGIVDGIKGFFGGGKKDQEVVKDSESSSDSASASSESASASSSTSSSADAKASEPAKPTKKAMRSAITYKVTQLGYEKVPRKEMKRMSDRLAAFDASDKSRRVREEALNNLEAFMYRARDYLEDESFIGASTSAIRSTLEEKLSAVSDWIHTDGPDAAEDVLKARLKDLTDLVDPVLNRKDEASKRPDAIKELRDALGGINEVIPMVKENIEKAAAKSKSAEEASKASASPSSTGSPDALDDLDDDASSTKESSSSSAMPPIPTVAADAEIYSESDLKFLQETAEKSTKWLEEKEAAQKQLSETDDPALTVKDINEQKKKVDDAVMEMMTKKFRFINRQQAEQRKEQERVAKEKARARKEKLKREKAAKKGKDKKGEKKEEAEAEAESKAEEQKKKNAEGPSEEELREALKKAGLASEDGIKLENLGPKDDLKDKDGNPLLKLNLDKDASEEDILAAIDAIVGEGREKKAKAEEEAKKKKKKEGEGHDEL